MSDRKWAKGYICGYCPKDGPCHRRGRPSTCVCTCHKESAVVASASTSAADALTGAASLDAAPAEAADSTPLAVDVGWIVWSRQRGKDGQPFDGLQEKPLGGMVVDVSLTSTDLLYHCIDPSLAGGIRRVTLRAAEVDPMNVEEPSDQKRGAMVRGLALYLATENGKPWGNLRGGRSTENDARIIADLGRLHPEVHVEVEPERPFRGPPDNGPPAPASMFVD